MNISIHTYSINNNNIEFFEFQKIFLNYSYEDYKDHEIFLDNKSKKVYFFLKKPKKVIVLTKNEIKNNFDHKIYSIGHVFNSNNIYKFMDNKMYMLGEKDFIERDLVNSKERNINIKKGKFGNFIDFDDSYILLAISLNNENYFFAFVNKNTFKLEKEKYYFETKNNYENTFIKIDNNHIFYAGYIFYITEDKKIITVTYYYINSNLKFNDYFLLNGKIYFILVDKLISLLFNNYNYNFYIFNFKNPQDFSGFKLDKRYDFDKLQIRKFEIFNTFKNKILTCPYCPLIPNFDINSSIKISCCLHSKYRDFNNIIYDIDDFLYYYNDLNSAKCYYCDSPNNLLFVIIKREYYYREIKSLYACKNCINNYKKKYNENLRLIDINNVNKCLYHNKNLNYIRNICDECNENEENKNQKILDDINYGSDEEFNYLLPSLKDTNNGEIIKKFIYIREEEKLENILYTDKEIEELKSKIKIIESKINDYYKNNIKEI